jgi:hypothetical protein
MPSNPDAACRRQRRFRGDLGGDPRVAWDVRVADRLLRARGDRGEQQPVVPGRRLALERFWSARAYGRTHDRNLREGAALIRETRSRRSAPPAALVVGVTLLAAATMGAATITEGRIAGRFDTATSSAELS